jgi:site-specific DNA-methyltransferase (cytosine-N4-specific)
VAVPYSDSMLSLLKSGYRAKLRPSGHDISDKFGKDNGAAIPPNLVAIAHTESNSRYLRYCARHDIAPHPARFPPELPEFFIRMLTDEGDWVLDPFAGSCVTGEVCERLNRKWVCLEVVEEYLRGARGRFEEDRSLMFPTGPVRDPDLQYRIYHPAALWDRMPEEPLRSDGGKERPSRPDAVRSAV